jgi:hypothetical protein
LLTQQHRQEALSRAYIQAVVGKVGMSCSFANFDYGIDLIINDITELNGNFFESGFRLDVQAKSSVNAKVEKDFVTYALEVKAYETLRVNTRIPRILVLLVLPTQEPEWMDQDEERLILRKCAYWISLKGRNLVANRTRVTIRIPRGNLFSVQGLQTIMETVKKGIDL